MPELFLIRKGGYYYRPNARGYTASVHEAGRFPKEEAFAHMDACAPGEIVIFPAPTISVSIAVEDDIRVTAEKIVLEHVASGSLNMDNLAGAIAGALEEERAKASIPAPEKHVAVEEPFANLVASARSMIESLDSEGHISPETCELINKFDRELEAAFPSIAPGCAAECQYAKDVDMREYRCSHRCQYLRSTPSPQPREVGE